MGIENQMTHKERIELMVMCIDDAREVFDDYYQGFDPGYVVKSIIAAAFFQYRAGQRDAADIPGNTPDNAADVEKD